MKNLIFITVLIAAFTSTFMMSCESKKTSSKVDVILDTDANNELDDQHALAYMMLNDDFFNILGITINATRNGGDISEHYKEAERIVKLCNRQNYINIIPGAEKSFEEIKNNIDSPNFDGKMAVDFIIDSAKKYSPNNKLTIIAIGKLTNIALAFKKDPSIIKNIRLLWLGSNYPSLGEYNLEDDVQSMNYVLNTDVHFELIPCRYNEDSGTDAVKVSLDEIKNIMPGLGPKSNTIIEGRHGNQFNCFGDYSVNLLENYLKTHPNNTQSRPLFDMAAVAIVKNPQWATSKMIPCPIMENNVWIENKNNRKIIIWEYFNKDEIISDFYKTMRTKK